MLNQFFTHIDDLRQTEPEYFQRGVSETVNLTPGPLGAIVGKTPVSLLEEFSKKTGKEAVYSLATESFDVNNVCTFVMQCVVRDLNTTGNGKTKKAAKHEAASDMLKQLVYKSLRNAKEMGIPHTSEKEAIAYLDSMEVETSVSEVVAQIDDCKPFSQSENYVGKVQEIAQRVKLQSAVYESSEEGPANDRTYITTCKINEHVTEGRAKQKKVSKSIAAYHMVCHLDKNLKSIIGMKEAMEDRLQVDECSRMCDNPSKISSSRTGVASLKEYLDSSVQLEGSTIEFQESAGSEFGASNRTILKLKLIGAEKEPRFLNFPGMGSSEEEAHNNAALLALSYLKEI